MTKFCVTIGIEKYDTEAISFSSLPSVKDDVRNAKQTAKLMGIPKEHTMVLKDANYEEIDKLFDWLKKRMKIISRELKNDTGIYGSNY